MKRIILSACFFLSVFCFACNDTGDNNTNNADSLSVPPDLNSSPAMLDTSNDALEDSMLNRSDTVTNSN